MCAKNKTSQQSNTPRTSVQPSSKFKVHLPLQICLHDPQTFQKARKLGILKPNHLNKLSIWKSSSKLATLPAHRLVPLTKAKHLKAFQYKSHKESLDNSSNTFGKLFPLSSIGLQKLCIELDHCYNLQHNPAFSTLNQIITIVPILRELSLIVSSSRKLGSLEVVNDRELLGIVQGLSRLVYLNSLHIEFKDCQKISNQGISALSNALVRLTQLQEFSFCMTDNITITDDMIAKVFDSIWRLSSLVTLTVDLTGSYQVENNSINMLARALSDLPQLQKLTIRLEGCQVGKESIVNLHKAIEKSLNLEELELKLGPKRKERAAALAAQSGDSIKQKNGGNIRFLGEVKSSETRRDSIPIGKTLGSLRRLQKLKLSLHESWTKGDEMIWDLAWAFPQLRNLTELNLKIFSENWSEIINDINIKMLCKAISRLGRNLEVLHLDLQWSKTATDNGMTSLAESLILLKELKELKLNFGEWNRITDKGISSLAKGISHLEKLEKLILRLNGAYNVGDEGVNRISEGLRCLTGLNQLHLNLERCSMVTKEALVRVGSVLGMLSDFQELYLSLEGCEELQRAGFFETFTKDFGNQTLLCEISCVKLVLKHISKIGSQHNSFGYLGFVSPEFEREWVLH